MFSIGLAAPEQGKRVPDTSNSRHFVAYYRVSTGKQGQLGFGLEAQRAMVREYVRAREGRLVSEFSEAINGLKTERPEMRKAISWSRIFKATLVVAKLDRLARSVDLIARVIDNGLDFVALDAPHANKFTLHILAALAEYESNLMSERMKAVSAALKARGRQRKSQRGGPPRGFPVSAWEASARTRRERSEARANDLAPLLWKMTEEGKSHQVIADEFNRAGVVPPRAAPWSKGSIARIAGYARADFCRGRERAPSARYGCAQARVEKQLGDAGKLLIDLWRDGKTYLEICDELARQGTLSPRGGRWGKASIRRYLMRALGVTGLRQVERCVA